jgi:hypothetical protein
MEMALVAQSDADVAGGAIRYGYYQGSIGVHRLGAGSADPADRSYLT